MTRLVSVMFAVLVACSGDASAPDAANAPVVVEPPAPPPAPIAPPPSPAGLRGAVTSDAIVITHGARSWHLPVDTTPGVTAALVRLTTEGPTRGLWVDRGTLASVYELGEDDAPRLLHSFATSTSPTHFGIGGGTMTSARLLDLDGDGIAELVLRHGMHDDTGTHERGEVLARGPDGGPFVASSLRAPPARAFYLNGGPIENAMRIVRGQAATIYALVSLETVPITPHTYATPSSAPPGVMFAAASLISSGENHDMQLHVIRAWPEATVLASLPIGVMREVFPDDACRLRVRLGIPTCRVTSWGDADEARAIAMVWPEDTARRATVLLWDGASLTTLREPVELDRCDAPARDLSLAPDAQGLPSLEPVPLVGEQTALW